MRAGSVAIAREGRLRTLWRVGLLLVCLWLALGIALLQAPAASAQGTELIIDQENQQVYVPDLGWLPKAEFWALYESQPGQLPSDIDFDGLRELGYPQLDEEVPEPGALVQLVSGAALLAALGARRARRRGGRR